MYSDTLTDEAAFRECCRILSVVSSRRRLESRWYGEEPPPGDVRPNRDSAFVTGMIAMFRYARGDSVPAALVMDFRDELLRLMFSGLASGALALPSFWRMSDKPWARAWRLAEIRLAFEGHETADVTGLAHLLGVTPEVLAAELKSRGFDPDQDISGDFLRGLYSDYIRGDRAIGFAGTT